MAAAKKDSLYIQLAKSPGYMLVLHSLNSLGVFFLLRCCRCCMFHVACTLYISVFAMSLNHRDKAIPRQARLASFVYHLPLQRRRHIIPKDNKYSLSHPWHAEAHVLLLSQLKLKLAAIARGISTVVFMTVEAPYLATDTNYFFFSQPPLRDKCDLQHRPTLYICSETVKEQQG